MECNFSIFQVFRVSIHLPSLFLSRARVASLCVCTCVCVRARVRKSVSAPVHYMSFYADVTDYLVRQIILGSFFCYNNITTISYLETKLSQ